MILSTPRLTPLMWRDHRRNPYHDQLKRKFFGRAHAWRPRAQYAQAERRERDARAIETFEAGVSAISEDMEQRVLEASYALREGLEEAEDAVATIRAELGLDDQLVQGDMTYVEVHMPMRRAQGAPVPNDCCPPW